MGGRGRRVRIADGVAMADAEGVEGKLIGSWDAGRRCRPPMARA